MRKQFFILVLLVGFLIPGFASASSPTYSKDHFPNDTIDFLIEPQQALGVGIPNLEEGGFIYIEIVVTSGEGIDVYLIDIENTNAFVESLPFEYAARYLDQQSLSTYVTAPTAGRWSVMFDNSNPISSVHIQGYVGIHFTETPSFVNTAATLITGSTFLFSLGIFLTVYRSLKKRRLQTDSSSSDSLVK